MAKNFVEVHYIDIYMGIDSMIYEVEDFCDYKIANSTIPRWAQKQCITNKWIEDEYEVIVFK